MNGFRSEAQTEGPQTTADDLSLSKQAQSALGTDSTDPFDRYLKRMQDSTSVERKKAQEAQTDISTKQIEMEKNRLKQEYDLATKQSGETRGIISDYSKQLMAPSPKREIEAQTKEGMMGLAALLPVAGAFFGGKGLTSATGAMQAMTGLVKGYQEGNKERIAFEQKKYDDAIKEFDRHQQQIKTAFDMALKNAQINQNAAQAKLKMDLYTLNAPMLAELVEKQGIVKTSETNIQMIDNVAKMRLQHEEKVNIAREVAGLKSETKSADAGKRMVNATAGAASGLEAIAGIKGGTTTGILPFLGTKEGITSFLSTKAGRQLTSDDAKILDVYYTGIARNLAAIEASGAATGLVGLTKSFENLKPMVGDSNYVVAAKLADAKRIVEETMKAAISSNTLSADQKKTAGDLVARIEKAIPFTVDDVNKAVTKGKPTIGQVTQKAVQGKPTTEQFLEKARAANPGVSDEQLIEYYKKTYGGQ